LDFFSESSVYLIAEQVVNFLVISEGKITHCLDLIPKLFVLLHTPNQIVYLSDKEEKKKKETGYEWKKMLVTDLCNGTWDSLKVSQIISTFKESKMSEAEMKIVVDKCVK
jgi:N-acetyl-beta-hexosaminidase